MATQVSARAKGRPRSCVADAAINAAALELLADEGFERFSMEAVAARAGVSKATVYRRFCGRDELLEHAMTQLDADIPKVPELGDFWENLTELLDGIQESSPGSLKSRIMIRVLSEGERHPQLQAMVTERVIRPRQARVRMILNRGIQSGKLRPGLDIEATIALLIGPMVWLKMLRLTPESGGASTEAIVEVLRTGLAPASHS
ncbi:MAG: TetR/AcrR family transcriptional regulator [Actinomycetota bacterium]|nr:TetR/AcrR family transcriptional regulator [Actinomycetota bacterium]